MAKPIAAPSFLRRAALNLALKALEWSGTYSITDPRLAQALATQTTFTGKSVSETNAMQVSAVWGCTRVIAEPIGSLPIDVLQKQPDGTSVPVKDHWLNEVLCTSPNADMTSQEFRENIGTALCLPGNFYAYVDRLGDSPTGRVLALTPLPTGAVQVERGADGRRVFKIYESGAWKPVESWRIWQVPGFGFDGLRGYSPISMMRQAIGLAMATEEFGARFFGQGAQPAHLVEVPGWLTDAQRAAAYKRLDEQFSGLSNAHRTFILEGGMKHVSVTMPLEDAQFILTRKFQIAEICRIYRVPLHMVQEMEGSTNNNVEWIGASLATHTLLPYFTRIEQSVGKYLLSAEDRAKGIYVRHNYEGMLRADTLARTAHYVAMLQNGVYNRNEVRAKENLPRVEGLDDRTVQLNMTPVDLLRQLAQSNIEK